MKTGTLNASDELEEYRFTFRCYLGIARHLAVIEKGHEDVVTTMGLLDSGRSYEESEDASAERAGKMLYLRYDMEHSVEGVNWAIRQYWAERGALTDIEAALWHRLCGWVDRIFEEDEAWAGGADQHHNLMTVAADAAERIVFYTKMLSDMHEEPQSPAVLETRYRAKLGAVLDLIPIR